MYIFMSDEQNIVTLVLHADSYLLFIILALQ